MKFIPKPTIPSVAVAISSLLLPVVHSATINVTVGGPGILKYNPQFVNANPGDVVRFIFQQKNHTATQSTFENPCAPAPEGFDSGFVPVADTQSSGFPVAQLDIIDNSPIWVYCRQANHCQQGMVFAVNPGDKFASFQAAATGGAAPHSTTTAPAVSTVTATVTISGQVATTTYTSSSSPVATAPTPTNYKITVGASGKLVYEPSNITAQAGDTVTFEFHQKNHTVTASSFSTPCRALSLTSTTGELGFDSGFQPVADGATIFPTYTIRVNDTKPIWAYCRQSNHCGQGMVFSINAIESGPNNFSAFQARAIQLNGTSSSSQPPNNAAPRVSAFYSTTTLTLLGLIIGIYL